MTPIEKIGAANAAPVIANPNLKGRNLVIYQPDHATVTLTITLTKKEFETAMHMGMDVLNLCAECGLLPPVRRPPDCFEIARDVAILGVQELIASKSAVPCVGADYDALDDEIPF